MSAQMDAQDRHLDQKGQELLPPPNELALELMGALRGPAEEEIALVDPNVFDHPDGVARLIARFEDHCKEEGSPSPSTTMRR